MPGTGCCGIEYGCVVEWGVTKLVEYDDFWGDVWYNFKKIVISTRSVLNLQMNKRVVRMTV